MPGAGDDDRPDGATRAALSFALVVGAVLTCVFGMFAWIGFSPTAVETFCAFAPAVGERADVDVLVARRAPGMRIEHGDGQRPGEHVVRALGGYMTTQVICEITIVNGRVTQKAVRVID